MLEKRIIEENATKVFDCKNLETTQRGEEEELIAELKERKLFGLLSIDGESLRKENLEFFVSAKKRMREYLEDNEFEEEQDYVSKKLETQPGILFSTEEY